MTNHKEIAIWSLKLLLAISIVFFAIAVGGWLIAAAHYFGGYWLSIPTLAAYLYGFFYLAFYTLDRID